MKKMERFFFASIVLLFFSACATVKTKNITIEDSGKTYNTKVGTIFEIKLKSIPTTGYTWNIQPYNENIIKLISSKYYPDNDLIGAPGADVIHIEVVGIGTTTFKLIQSRIWEKDEPPIKKIEITIKSENH